MQTTYTVVLLVLGFIGVISFIALKRSSADVLVDLTEDEAQPRIRRRHRKLFSESDNLTTDEKSFLSEIEISIFKRMGGVGAVIVGIVALIVSFLLGAAPGRSVFIGILSASIVHLLTSKLSRLSIGKRKRDLDFFLPVVMERLVMAVQAGLDILPAVRTLVELGKEEGISEKVDPVTTLLGEVHSLCEAGMTFEQALDKVATRIDSGALRHAFVHLAVSHKEGGELVMPLRELSDSTQLFYQEIIEEEIAKMPVKATMPLLCTFAGLVLTFLTTPLIQLMSITAKALPK